MPNIATLQKEIVPFSYCTLHLEGVEIVDNPDPVLNYLAQKSEEHWRTMERSEPAIYAAKMHRVRTLLSAGSEVLEGRSGSPRAIMLRDWTIQFLKRIPNFSAVQEACLDGIYWGWRPLEVLWDFEFRFKRKNYWGVRVIHEKKPEDFKFTTERDLVWCGGATDQEQIVFSRPEDKYKWLICTAGSTDNPYGNALYRNIWLIWYIKNKFMKMWSQGMERSLGVLKAKQEFEGIEPGQKAKTLAALGDELAVVMETLSQNNILIERSGWTLDFMSDIEFSDAWQHPLSYCDELITLAIAGQTMTMRIGSTGSRSAAQVHRQGLTDFAKSDAKQLEGWINDQLIGNAIQLNFGDVMADDLPKWRTNIRKPISIENSQIMWNMGAPIDGRRLAQAVGVPLLPDPGKDDVLLLKPPDRGPGSPVEALEEEDTEDTEREDDDKPGDNRPRTISFPKAM